jgi:hypothetical protein
VGEIRQRIHAFREQNPNADFAEVADACLSGVDGKYVFRSISPRLFEATSTMTSQILLSGDYLGIVKPWEHYIPVAQDYSNLEEVLEATADLPAAQRRAEACFETLVHNPALHYPSFVRDTIAYAEAKVEERGLVRMDPERFHELVEAHQRLSWSDRAIRAGLGILRRFSPTLRRVVPRRIQAQILARLGRRVGLK